MVYVDLICSNEYLPRVKLLVNHLSLQKIRIRVRDQMPAKPTDRVIVLPNHLDEVEIPEAVEVVALYFDKPEATFSSHQSFHIPTWPARSSDHQVNELAALLRRPVHRTTKKSTQSAQKTKKRERDPANRIALVSFFTVIAILYFFGGTDEPQQQVTEEDRTQIEIARTFSETRSSGHNSNEAFVSMFSEEIDLVVVSEAYLICVNAQSELKFDLLLPFALTPSHAWCPAPPQCAWL